MYRMSFRDYVPETETARNFSSTGGLRPAWAVINDKGYGGPEERKGEILEWKNRVISQLLEWREPVTMVQRTNRLIYLGQHYMNRDVFERLPYNKKVKYSKNTAKIVVNYIQYLVDQHVSDLAAYEPNLTVTPMHDEEMDRVAARAKKDILDFYFYEKKVKFRFQKFDRATKIDGEAFWFCLWDPDAGDYSPAYKKLREMRLAQAGEGPVNDSVPLVDPKTGAAIMSASGEPLFIEKPVKVGDLLLEQVLAEQVLYPYPKSMEWDDVPFLILLKWMPVDEAKARWPHVAEELKGDTLYSRYFPQNSRTFTEDVCVRFMYHKPDRYLENGYFCVSTESSFCEEGRYPFDHTYLPCIRGTDIDAPGELHGVSFIQNLASLQHALNNSTSMILQNQSLFAYPKYAAPRGAKVRYRELDDDRGVYEYSGPKPPEIVAQNSTPSDTWRWSDALRDHMKTLSGIYATSEGRAPDGITANVALRMIDEQERKFRKPTIDKRGELVQRFGEMQLSVLGTYRDPSDGAMIKVIGKNNERYLRYLDVQNLSRPTEVKLLRSSGLPESPAARTQTVLDMADRFQGIWTNDEVLEYMDIQRPEKLVESATVARQSAESEVEDILQGVPVPSPMPYHDILPRYRVYEKAMQSRAFDEAPPEVKQRFIQHVITAEYLIMRKMRINPAFMQQVQGQFPNFPMFMPTQPQPVGPAIELAQPIQPMLPAPGDINSPDLGGMPPEAAGPGAAIPPEAPQIPAGPTPPQSGPLPQPAIPPSPGSNLP